MVTIHYGYTDGSGDYYIIVDGSICDGCAICLESCPRGVWQMGEDLDGSKDVAQVRAEVSKDLKYVCAGCKPYESAPPPPCISRCPHGAISHSW